MPFSFATSPHALFTIASCQFIFPTCCDAKHCFSGSIGAFASYREKNCFHMPRMVTSIGSGQWATLHGCHDLHGDDSLQSAEVTESPQCVLFSIHLCIPLRLLSNFSMVSPLPNCLMLTSFPFLSLRSLDILQADQKRNWNHHHSFYHLHPHTNQNPPYLERRLSHPCNQRIAFFHGAATHNKVHYVLLLATSNLKKNR